MLNAYTVKKILPRLLIAVIGINLSYYLVVIAIDIANILGDGIADLMTKPFQNIGMTWDPGDLSKIIISVIAVIAAYKIFKRVFSRSGRRQDQSDGIEYFLIATVLPIVLIILAIFAVLAIRLGLMVALALASPIACAAFVLPGTEKLAKKWWELFMTTLMIYPIVMGMMALGRVMTYIFGNTNGGVVAENITGVFAVVAQFVPLAAIPFSFKMAGGIIGKIGNFVTGGGMQSIRSKIQGDERDPNSRINRAKAKRDNADLNRRLAGNARAASFTNNRKTKLGKWAGSKFQRSVAGYDVLAAQSAQNKRVGEEMSDTIATGDDSQIRALTARKMKMADGSEKWISAGGKEMKESDVMAARQRWGNNTSAYQRALTYEMSKVSTPEEAAMVAQAFDGSDGGGALAKEWGLSEREAKGLWTGAAYANQNKRLEWKYMSYDANANPDSEGKPQGGMVFDSAGFATEIYEHRGSYQMSQMGSSTINALRQEHNAASEALEQAQSMAPSDARDAAVAQAEERLQRIGSIADTFVGQARAAGELITGEDGTVESMGNGAGHVNDEIKAFVNEVRTGGSFTRAPAEAEVGDRPMTGPVQAPQAPAGGSVYAGTRAKRREETGTPPTHDSKY